MAEDDKGLQEALLHAVNNAGSGTAIQIKEFKGSGDYLAFLDEGDPIYLPREIMDWLRARQESESFLKRLARQLKVIS